MDSAYWHGRWHDGKTLGFHEGAPNAYLTKHAHWLAPCRRILVPLCGKTEDLAFLAGHGHDVVGIELVEDAVKQFFAEHDTTPAIEPAGGGLTRYRAGSITILCGDLFATTPTEVGSIDGIYDRAALVALPPDMRARYVNHLGVLAPRATRELLLTIEYPAGALNGPPFSVEEPEVRAHFASAVVTEVDYGRDTQNRLDGTMYDRCYTIAFA